MKALHPLPNSKQPSPTICLRGFSETDLPTTTDWLRARGHRIVRSLEAAQVVLAGPNADSTIMEQVKRRGIQLMPWEQFRTEQELSALAETSASGTAPVKPATIQPLFESTEKSVRLLNMRIPVEPARSEDERLIPTASDFRHICFDQPFAETLRAVTLGVLEDVPVALEGETSASKTTAVQWLAHLLKRPVIRFNLNGQTDTGELVGRYVPATSDDGYAAQSWRFQEGYLPRALAGGWWLLLDEMNLAEPQILERLNSVLENPATFILTEGDGRIFGHGISKDVHIDSAFRIFATLNPAEYSGRSILSPAFRDRWSIWHHARTAGEAECLSMLRFAVFGQHPIVHFHGVSYQAPDSEPAFPELQALADTEQTLQRVALFHASVVKASGTQGDVPGLGRNQRERYTFTRRILLNTLRLTKSSLMRDAGLCSATALRESITTLYVERLRDSADRRAVQSLMRAAGLS